MDIKYPLIGSITGLIVYTLFNAFLRDAKNACPENQLVYGRGIRITSVGAFIAAAFIGNEALQASPEQRVLAYIIATLLLGGSLCFMLETFLTRLTYDSAFVYTSSAWRGRRKIPYSAIAGFESFSQTFYENIFRTEGFGKLRISVFLKGADQFVKLLEEKASLAAKISDSQGAN